MKTKFAVLLASFIGFSGLTAEIVVNDYLSFQGFADMSYTYLDKEKNESLQNQLHPEVAQGNAFQVNQ